MDYTIIQLLEALIEQRGSDLHISANSPPRFRINGKLWAIDTEPLNSKQTSSLCYDIMSESQKKTLEKESELDFSFSIENIGRFRANVFQQKTSTAGVFRAVPFNIRTIDELGLPAVLKSLADSPRGLILVTGATGSGKSTTLAAIVDHINRTRRDHILTIEDPIEFLHQSKRCLINQREIGGDTNSFVSSLRSALRQDIDVVLIGELRDLESAQQAVTIAETGHLVLGTLHTNSASSSLNRLIDTFPYEQQSMIRMQLSLNLIGVVSQTLIAANNTQVGRVLGMEIMIPNIAIRNLIRENKIHQIYSTMQIGQQDTGMITMNQSLVNLWAEKKITAESAISKTHDADELLKMMETKGVG